MHKYSKHNIDTYQLLTKSGNKSTTEMNRYHQTKIQC